MIPKLPSHLPVLRALPREEKGDPGSAGGRRGAGPGARRRRSAEPLVQPFPEFAGGLPSHRQPMLQRGTMVGGGKADVVGVGLGSRRSGFERFRVLPRQRF